MTNNHAWMNLNDVQNTVDKHCANMTTGHRCGLMNGKPCLYHRNTVNRCSYAESAVLDNEPHVQQEYVRRLSDYAGTSNSDSKQDIVNCCDCGSRYVRTGNRQIRCESCQERANKRKNVQRVQRHRTKQSSVLSR